MKAQPLIAVVAAGLAAFGTVGCTTTDAANTKKNRDDVARMNAEAQAYEKKDGSLAADYLVELALNGSGKKANKPVFDQPRGDDETQ